MARIYCHPMCWPRFRTTGTILMAITRLANIGIDFLIITTPANVLTKITVEAVNHTIVPIIILAKTFTGTFITPPPCRIPILIRGLTIFTTTPRINKLPRTAAITRQHTRITPTILMALMGIDFACFMGPETSSE